MGSMWMDDDEDKNVYPVQGLPVPDFDDTLIIDRKKFPEERWAADFESLLVLTEFIRKDYHTNIRIAAPPPTDSAAVVIALEKLVLYQKTLRDKAAPEILQQSKAFQAYFCAQLGIWPRTYPNTYLLLKMAARIGELVMVKLKRHHEYPRPSQLYPRLTPLIPVPGHSSYPSGHSLIGHLMAYTAIDIVPNMGDAPTVLAARIAQNREVAGVHYDFDSAGGQEAAYQAFNFYKTMGFFGRTKDKAVLEWLTP